MLVPFALCVAQTLLVGICCFGALQAETGSRLVTLETAWTAGSTGIVRQEVSVSICFQLSRPSWTGGKNLIENSKSGILRTAPRIPYSGKFSNGANFHIIRKRTVCACVCGLNRIIVYCTVVARMC